ncbi:hypothetical protein [Chengkuizengella axinellae]|uniref:DUF1436 family protein n=1 Tax=Chengkuizengella axinellae TaxID=3064388 RepID=A0ABT9IZL1_9BACL|nr:hypothetical protein [Chengkuizengella sp. 2205SS18-9]MDP5274811.1 hypothetical protein [Chengkuizengella sp. 2205SS18-9]
MKKYYSMSIYKNEQDDSMLMYPIGKHEVGYGVPINKPYLMDVPYTAKDVGITIKECLNILINNEYTDEEKGGLVHEKVTGTKSFSKFVKLYKYVSVALFPSEGYVVNPWVREKRGYTTYKDTPELNLNLDATEEDLGKGVLKMFEMCK